MLLLYNANIYTRSHEKSALVIDNGKFAAIGSNADILNGFPKAQMKFDLQGRTIWPGLTDSHLHLNYLADSLFIVDCETDTLEECLARIQLSANNLPKDSWIIGHGWNQNVWQSGFGNAKILDAVCKGRPAFLTAKSLHAAWVNSHALKLANIHSNTPDPPGGLIQRGHDNHLTGILFENAAMNIVRTIIPKPSRQERLARYQELFKKLFEQGIVNVHDFDGHDCWDTLQELYQSDELPLRVRKSIPLDHLELFISNGMKTNFGDDKLNIGCVKLFADGALGPQTAALKSPYEDSDNRGVLLLTEQEILEIGEIATLNGIALAVHAIGDRTNHIVLNAFEQLREFEQTHHIPHLQHRIEHVQIIDPKDLPRLSELDITASVQPIHAPSDIKITEKYLGDRASNAYAFRTILENNINCIFGSDAPVETSNPFRGLYAAVTRQRLDGSPGEDGWYPDQRLNLDEALEGYTFKPASLTNSKTQLGRIEKNYKADFLILNEDPFSISSQRLAGVKPVATFIDGACVYKSSTLPMDFLE